MWPGYGENSRVLKWVFERTDGQVGADKTAIGFLPAPGTLDIDGLNVSEADMQVLLSVDNDGWREAVPQIREHYAAFGDRLPQQLSASLDSLEAALA
jgi:phosphoenolpyruvate carboxykinase (GTP)